MVVTALAWPSGASAATDDACTEAMASAGQRFIYCYQGQVQDSTMVVVDKSLQRAMVFKYLGDMALEWEFPCGTGQNQGDKAQAGDEKTPEGVYFVTHRYEDSKVTIFGDRALHLDYPNAIDLLDGRKGCGIYLHGTNRDLKPRSSNGCVTLDNRDLARLGPMIRDQSTPVLVLDRFSLPKPADQERACQFLQKLRFKNFDLDIAPDAHSLSFRQTNVAFGGHKDLEARLAQLRNAGDGPVKLKVTGVALWGTSDQWVVLANLDITGRDGKVISVTRRLYYQGFDPDTLILVRSQWILEDSQSAQTLASWLPDGGVKTASSEPLRPQVAAAPAAPSPARAAAPAASDASVARAKPAAEATAAEPKVDAEQEVRAMLKAWMAAWTSKNLKRYMTYYAGDFRADGMDRQAWRDKKAYLNKVYDRLSVQAKNLTISVNGQTAKVRFVQHYQSDWHKDVGVKNMTLVHVKGRWLIKGEEWRPIKPVNVAAKRARR